MLIREFVYIDTKTLYRVFMSLFFIICRADRADWWSCKERMFCEPTSAPSHSFYSNKHHKVALPTTAFAISLLLFRNSFVIHSRHYRLEQSFFLFEENNRCLPEVLLQIVLLKRNAKVTLCIYCYSGIGKNERCA